MGSKFGAALDNRRLSAYRDTYPRNTSPGQFSPGGHEMVTETARDLAEMTYSPVLDEETMRALRKIWLEAIMVETFEDAADLIQSALIPD